MNRTSRQWCRAWTCAASANAAAHDVTAVVYVQAGTVPRSALAVSFVRSAVFPHTMRQAHLRYLPSHGSLVACQFPAACLSSSLCAQTTTAVVVTTISREREVREAVSTLENPSCLRLLCSLSHRVLLTIACVNILPPSGRLFSPADAHRMYLEGELVKVSECGVLVFFIPPCILRVLVLAPVALHTHIFRCFREWLQTLFRFSTSESEGCAPARELLSILTQLVRSGSWLLQRRRGTVSSRVKNPKEFCLPLSRFLHSSWEWSDRPTAAVNERTGCSY